MRIVADGQAVYPTSVDRWLDVTHVDVGVAESNQHARYTTVTMGRGDHNVEVTDVGCEHG